jgi:ACS family hexuronate transporter-like MFS transporter
MSSWRWGVAILLFLSTVINYIDRQTLSVLAPTLTKELGISDQQYSNILTAFLAAYTVMYAGSGFLVDRWGTRFSLGLFMVWWSAANSLHALVRGPWSLGAFRFLLGAGESGNFMAAFKGVSEWYAPKDRAFINGLIQAGASVGAVVAPPVVTVLASHYGWRMAFLATGALGLFWLIPWVLVTRRAEALPLPEGPRRQWTEMLRYRQTWGLLAARFLSDPVWWFYLFWLPKYLVDQRGFTVAEMGMLAWMPYLTADAGSLVGGWLSGQLIRRGWTPVDARRAWMLPFAALMPLSMAVGFVESRTVSLALICIVTFAHMGWKTNQATLTNDIYPREVVGTVAGLLAFGNGMGGTIFTALTGWMVVNFSYASVFVLMGLLHPISYLIVRWLVRTPLQTTQSSHP